MQRDKLFKTAKKFSRLTAPITIFKSFESSFESIISLDDSSSESMLNALKNEVIPNIRDEKKEDFVM